MFVPPPTPALSKAEIEARRGKNQYAPNASSVSSFDGSGERSPTMVETTSLETPGALIRRIGIFGLGKDDKKTRPAIEISAPILSVSPTRSPPAVPEKSLIRSRPGHPPLLDTAKGQSSSSPPRTTIKEQSNSASTAVSPTSPSPGCPPRRPPRPAADLTLESTLVSPGLHPSSGGSSNGGRGYLTHSRELFDPSLPQARGKANDRSMQFMASGTPPQPLRAGGVNKPASKRGNALVASIDEESNGLRNLIKPRQSKKLKDRSNIAAEHQRVSSLEAALLGLGGIPEQAKPNTPRLTIHAVTYSPKGYQHVAAADQDRALLDTRSSILQTPRELYETSRGSPRHAMQQELRARSDMPTLPVKTQLHLRGGSVVTVTPPELNAWTRTIYLQGPIRLSKPAIIPRKNSLASLEPFQEAVDHVYQDALRRSSRRHSDEAAAREICDFFIHFETCDVYPHLGALGVEQGNLSRAGKDEQGDEEYDAEEEDEDDIGFDTEQEVPDSPEVSTVLPRAAVMPVFDLPPVETEETLRARGIARLLRKKGSQQAETKGVARTANAVLTLVPVPEDSILASAVRSREESSL